MTKWAASLIRISNHEVETLQKRLAEITERRVAAELRIAMLDAEAENEAKNAETDASAGWYMIGYREGYKRRRADMLVQIDQCQQEEIGARDALSEAFENLKKYEHVAEQAKVLAAKKLGAFEAAQMDELSIRRAAVGGVKMQRLTRRSAIASALALSACGREAASQTYPPISDTPLKSIATTPVGACVQHAFLQDPAYAELLARHYAQLTPEWEMKMEYILQDDGRFRFDRPDAIADFARRHGIRLYGTTLVWYDQAMPAFLRLDGQGKPFADAYRNYILAVAGRYRGQAVGWDVVNETVADNGTELRQSIWTRNLGVDEHMVLAFHHAKEADPNATLFINDYHLENNPTKRATFMRTVERLLKAGAPIGGIGTQSHLDLDFTRPGMARAAMRDLAGFGLPIHVSELDISLGEKPDFSRLADLRQRQADLTRELAESYMSLPQQQRFAFTVWGLRDQDSWLRGASGRRPRDQSLPFDDAGRPKPMFQALAEVLSG